MLYMDRRQFLATCGGGVIAALAGCTEADEEFPSTDTQNSTPTSTETDTLTDTTTRNDTPLGGSRGIETETPKGPPSDVTTWLKDANGYNGEVVDKTDQTQVTITVGAQADSGAIAFEPALVKISRGSLVQFKWTGNGGEHSVTGSNTTWGSDLYSKEGVNFTIAAPQPPYSLYYCETHKSQGMKGAILIK